MSSLSFISRLSVSTRERSALVTTAHALNMARSGLQRYHAVCHKRNPSIVFNVRGLFAHR